MRDDFSEPTKRVLGARAGYRCSNPECRAATSGPQVDAAKAVNVGVAAHVTAASPGGPRFDSNLSEEERRLPENGIWLCQNCAKLIDSDSARFTTMLLHKWKSSAEEEAQQLVGRISLNRPVRSALRQLPGPPADFTGRERELQELLQAVRVGAVVSAAIMGMGGVGKTSLALKLADLLVPEYPDAQFYLDLRGTKAQREMTAAEAMTQVVRGYDPIARLPREQEELATIYRSKLHGQKALLLMDNAKDAAQIAPLMPPAGCLMLVTSRQHFTLPGLVSRNIDVFPSEDARSFVVGIAPRIGAQAGEFAELCGNLALALRVAASAVATRRNLSPCEYIEMLRVTKEHLDLVDANTGLSVTASVRLSYGLLSPDLQKRWRMLAIFPATFDSAGAGAVWETDDRSAKASLSLLLEYSLVEWYEATSRYRLHDLLREVANERLGPE